MGCEVECRPSPAPPPTPTLANDDSPSIGDRRGGNAGAPEADDEAVEALPMTPRVEETIRGGGGKRDERG